MVVLPTLRRRWPRLLTKPDLRRLVKALNEVWRAHAAGATDLEVNFVDEPTIRALHRDFLHDDASTDVITFDLGATPAGWRITAIAICVPVAQQYAKQYLVPLRDELQRLVIHGALHLLGYDDHGIAEKRRMRYHENKIFRQVKELAREQ